MRGLIRILGTINHAIALVGLMVSSGLVFIMTAAVILQVVSREMRTPVGWTEELALVSMTSIAFLVGPWGYRHHLFTRIDLVIEALKGRTRLVLLLLMHVFEVFILVVALYYGWLFFEKGNSLMPQLAELLQLFLSPVLPAETTSGIEVRTYWIYSVVPIGFAGLLLVGIEHILRTIVSITSGESLVLPGITQEASVGVAGSDFEGIEDRDEIGLDKDGGGR